MRTIEIPDAVYEEAASRAASHGLSLETFVTDALTTYFDDAPVRLTPEQLELIAEAEADIDAGRFYTAEQMRELLDRNREDWTRENAA